MRYLTEPKIYLVSRPSVDWEKMAELLADEDLPGVCKEHPGGRGRVLGYRGGVG